MAEDQLLRRAQQGDPQAIEALCRREWRPVYGLLYRTLGNRAEAEDLTQEVFVRALQALDRYQDTGVPFHAFLTTIARNLLRSQWRRKVPHLVELDGVPDMRSHEQGPETTLLASERRRQLEQALATLAPDYQTVIRLRLLEERSSEEVAALMDRSPGAVRVLQHRALAQLRSRLRKGSAR